MTNMKVAYLGKIQLSDTDLPFLHEAQQMADVTYFIEVNPRFMQGPHTTFSTSTTSLGCSRQPTSIPNSRSWMDSSTLKSVMC